ncbi:baseplate assembly protein [Selenomonas ruminantium]|uniref:baseplate assembly protein n=1 Tax=Selenomonas ruminantium TaxID=971 RepID=UPI000421F993|nr:baseplate J/gp47 family protein [Selenomonas ruminantium]
MTISDIDFLDTDTDTIKSAVIGEYEELTARTLATADPVRLFLESIASIIAQQRVLINYTGKMNLLAYSQGNFLDHIGALVGTARIPAAAATSTFQITLSAVRDVPVTIPAGTRVAAADNVFFSLDVDTIILAGELSAETSGTCTQTGAVGNGYIHGEIKTIVDPVPYVESIVNLTTTEGGADIEDDESYRTRIQEAPERFSVAGPTGAYEYFAKMASALITDVAVTSPFPGEVYVYPLLEGGSLPGEEIIHDVEEMLNDDSVRPLTDKVTVLAPSAVSYDIELSYYIDTADATRARSIQSEVQKAVEAYILWQKSKLGRDINPTELYYRLRAAGAKRAVITAPEFLTVNAESVAIADSVTVNYGGLEDG